MTFSIVAADPQSGEVGIAVESKFLSVGAVVPWVRAGAGAIATQAFANTAYGPRALEMLSAGNAPGDVAAALVKDDENREDRQFGVVDVTGRAATFTGEKCITWAGGIAGPGFAAQGNILAGAAVVDALATSFTGSSGPLADRLIGALRAAQDAGGDKRGQQSAALVIEKPRGGYAGFNDRYVDLRVDDHPAPIEELARLLELHKLYFSPPQPQDVIPIDDALGRELVRELVRIGALDGGERFDERARTALVSFMHVENLENRVRDDGAVDRQTLEYLRNVSR
ncbi:MAG TPA: DUF1028 domain-containing protein [Candidatus Baltobacteraceae bacterium]|nr:DUF1028 domain-containing protein [Candidatus Baltobacteraceae bacterium]